MFELLTRYLTDQVLTTGQIRCAQGCCCQSGYFRTPTLNPETPSYDSSDRYDYIPEDHVFETQDSATIKARQMLQDQIEVLQKEQQKLEGYLEKLQDSDGVDPQNKE